jgi:DNA-binding transcriptional LysR family regulator
MCIAYNNIDDGVLHIGSTVTIGSYYLPAYLVDIQALHPGLQVSMTTADSEGVVQALNKLDMGFIEGEVSSLPDSSIFEVMPWQ